MIEVVQKFQFAVYEYYRIQKEEIPFYLEKYDRILALTIEDIHNTLKSDELIYSGHQFKKKEYRDDVLNDFLFEIKHEKLCPHPYLTLDDLIYYVGVHI